MFGSMRGTTPVLQQDDVEASRGSNPALPFRVLIGGLFHETHAFLDGSTGWDAFEVREGDAILAAAGDASPLGGVLELAARNGWEIIPTITATAVPSAIVDDEVVEMFWTRFASRAGHAIAAGVDAIYLVLHGAFVSASFHDVEGEVLRRIRQLPGARSLPIFGVYDLHANFSHAMAALSDGLVAYRENPHRDGREAAIRAALLMQRAHQQRVRPHQYCLHAPLIWPPTGTASAVDPMRRLLRMARQFEQQNPDFWAVNVNAGFAFSDTPDTGVSFGIVTTGDEATARRALQALVRTAIEHAAEGNVIESPLADVLARLREQADKGSLQGLNVIAEPSDNIGGGGPGDGTGLLRGLIDYGISNSAVCLWDPAAVESLQSVHVGERRRLRLGGRGSRLDPGPIDLECELVRVGDGRFELEDKRSHLATVCGDRFDMGRFAVVRHQGVTILLTTNRTPPMDLGQWRHAGIEPTGLSVIGVKAAVAHRQAYDPIATHHDSVATPGPCQSLLSEFPYRSVRRPIYPLDSLAALSMSLESLSMNDWYRIENANDIASPTLLVYPDRIEENLRRMIACVGDVSRLRPHVKTHKMPQVIAMKIAAGIHKFKASTIAEAEMTAAAGGQDVLLAYQPVGPNIQRFMELIKCYPQTTFSTLVDNVPSLFDIATMARSYGVAARLMIDLNVGMDRTGIAVGPQAAELYRLICETDGVEAVGLHAYDGHLHEPDAALLATQASETFAPVWSLRQQLQSEGLDVPLVVAGGTPTSKLLASQDGVEVGAGTTVLWDFGQAETSPDLNFQNAAVLLARVISRPTANRICIDLGHKAVASEMAPPRVRWFGLEDAKPVMHNEEHLVLEVPDSHELRVGTVLYGIPRHICPTVALHHQVWCVRDRIAVETWPVVARARCITI
ncbi:MAG: M81 family metallopeptidase [Planctomycetaceae bacterium]